MKQLKQFIKRLLLPKAKDGENILEIAPTVKTTMPDEHMNYNQWVQHISNLTHKNFAQ